MALTPKYLQECTDDIEKIYWELGTDILVDIAERIKAVNGMTATAEYLNEKLREMGLQQAWINQMLAKVMNTTEQEVEKLMNESTHKSTRSTFDILKKAGYDTTGLEFSDQILKTTNTLNGDLQNLTRTTGQLATKAMMNAYDQAYLQVSSGAYSLDQAVTNAIQKLAKDGLGQVEYPSGAHRTVEAAVRVAVRTAVNQNALACEMQIVNDLGINLVETSSHIGARPSHEVWQGKVFWINHPEGNYENFYEATGYGTSTGLGGYNCRHQFYPYFPEFGQTYKPIPHEINDAAYKAEQRQRAYERKIREWDRKERVLKAGGQDATEARRWKNYYKGQIQKLVDQSKGFLKRDYSAERSYGNKDFSKAQKKKTASKQSGGLSGALNDKNDPKGKRRDKHAEKYYASMRNSNRETNINAIYKSSGLSRDIVEAAFKHVFEDRHPLEKGYTYFDPSYDMAESWRRLRTNDNVQPHDIILLKHEALESKIWAEHPDWDYWHAHSEAEKVYNYTEALIKWKEEHTK